MILEITIAKDNDATALASILTEATKYKMAHGDIAWGDEPFTQGEVKNYMNKGSTYVASLNNELIGTFSLLWEDNRMWGEQPSNAAYLHRFAIKQGFHGKELGQQILKRAEQETIKNGRQILRLDCEEKNTGLCNYYERLGFIKIGTKNVISNKIKYSAALFEKTLTT